MNILKKINEKKLSKESLIEKYTDQASNLPDKLVQDLELAVGDVQLFAFVDLNREFQLEDSWLILTEDRLVYAELKKSVWISKELSRESIKAIQQVKSLSCHRLVVEADNDELVVRYSHRQSRAIGVIEFVIEQDIECGSCGKVKPSQKAESIYEDKLLQPLLEAQASVAGNRLAVVWRLLGYLKPYRKQVTIGLASAICMTLVSLIPAFITGYLIDSVIKPFQGGSLSFAQANQLVMLCVGALVSIYAMREVFAWLRLKTMSVMGEYVARDLRNEAYSHLQKLSLSFFSSRQTGSLISRVGSDTDRIWDFVAFGVVEVTTSLIMLTGLSVVLMSLDFKLGLLVTLPVPIILWAIARHGQTMQSLFIRAWRKWSNLTDCLSDTIPGIKVVKAFNKEGQETEKFKKRNEVVFEEFNSIHKEWTSFWPLLMLSIQAIVIAVWFFGAPRMLEHIAAFKSTGAIDVGLSPGVFISFVLYLGMFVHPIEIIGQMARMVNRATSSAHRVFEVLDTEPQIMESHNPVVLKPMKGGVSFKDVTFSYDGVRTILKNLSFDVKPGEMIGLVGSSGGGKTTITNLIARFYDAEGGSIKIDGVDIKSIETGSLRDQIGMVLQDPYLFHGSILENIRYAKPEASIESVIEAAKTANAHEFILRLSHGYDTIVGERGKTLSGGERQRVSIARAILRDPRVLILDEATSAVDTETEKKIQEALDRLVSGRTVFAIAHRLSTLQQADRLFVIDRGQLAEQGTHTELMNIEKGIYRKLVKMQQSLGKGA